MVFLPLKATSLYVRSNGILFLASQNKMYDTIDESLCIAIIDLLYFSRYQENPCVYYHGTGEPCHFLEDSWQV